MSRPAPQTTEKTANKATNWIVSFVLMAALFGGVTEAFNMMDTDEPYSLSAALTRGLLFSTAVTAWLMWNERRKAKEEHHHG